MPAHAITWHHKHKLRLCLLPLGIIHLEVAALFSWGRKRQLQRTRFASRVGPLLNNKLGNHDGYI